LLVSQLLTLYITPVYYVYIENARLRAMRRRSSDHSVSAAAPPGATSHPVPALADAPPALQRTIEGGGV
jgi:hypothetical protein